MGSSSVIVEELTELLGLGDRAEDFDEPVRNNLVLALLQLPDSKTERVRVARRAMIFLEVFTWRAIWISSAHAACPGTHAAYAKRPGVREFLHSFRPCDTQFRRNLPTVAWSDIA